jgi:6-phosphogluconolactonase
VTLRPLVLLVFAAGCVPRAAPRAAAPAPVVAAYVYVGTAGGEVLAFALDGGHLLSRGSVSAGRGPVALAARPGGRFVYAATGAGEVAVLAVRNNGGLAMHGRGSARGAGPSALAVHRGGKYLLAANGGSGTAAVLPIRPDGSLASGDTFAAGQPSGSSPHLGIAPHPLADVVFVADAPGARISQFVFNTGTGILTPSREPALALTPQSAPGRIAFHPAGRFVYVMEEGLGVIACYTFEPISGSLTVLSFQTIPIAEEAPPAEPAGRRRARNKRPPAAGSGDLVVAPGGRFLYAVDGAHEVVSIFAIDAEAGTLTVVARADAHGRRPAMLALADRGRVMLVGHQEPPGVATFFTDELNGTIVHAAETALRTAPRSLLVVSPSSDAR